MLTFLTNVWNAIEGIISFIIHGIESLVILMLKIPTYIAMLTNLIAEIPATYQAVILATISLSVIFFISNRGK